MTEFASKTKEKDNASMNEAHFLENIKEKTQNFEPITLQEMDGVKLMDRVDVKYLIPLYLLPQILEDAKPYYRLLEINGDRICPYETLYFDTDDLNLYHNHQAGKRNRYKIRFRNYVNSNLSFFEIKHKNNKGRTIKTRIKQSNEISDNLDSEKTVFLEKTTPLAASKLKGNLWVNYSRMTLVNKTSAERLTIDLNLNFRNDTKEADFSKTVIAEVKQERLGSSPITEIFRKYNLREGSISKYCLGIISTYENIKFNRFKRKFLYLQKIINQYDSFTAAC